VYSFRYHTQTPTRFASASARNSGFDTTVVEEERVGTSHRRATAALDMRRSAAIVTPGVGDWDLDLGIWDLGFELVAVRGYEKGCSLENVEFVGIAA
jgi:hypothetical protein